MENRAGRGPCYLRTEHITKAQEQDLYKAYLNMAPSQTLKWLEEGQGPSVQNVEIEGTEPYIVGGHTASGYWIDNDRRTTLPGLYAAGDVAGGCPQKYVTGALAEGEIAAEAVLRDLQKAEEESAGQEKNTNQDRASVQEEMAVQRKRQEYEAHLARRDAPFSTEQIEEAMQKIMDQYAGGILTDYQYNEKGLKLAEKKIRSLIPLAEALAAADMDDLLRIYELKERLVVCQALIAHLAARRETRWHSFGEYTDYPEKSQKGECYVNSRMRDGRIEILYRDLVKL
jgi:adenylylsulfate reductase subunit A